MQSAWRRGFTGGVIKSLSVLVVHAAVSPAVAHWVVVLGVVGAEPLDASSAPCTTLGVVTGLAVETCRGGVRQLVKIGSTTSSPV